MSLNDTKYSIWVLTSIMAFLTIFFNVYIVLTNLKIYRKNGHLLPCEIIITTLCFCNGAHQLACYLWMTLDNLDIVCILNDLVYSLLIVVIYSLKFSIVWTTAFLSFFYSTKLVIEPIHCYTRIQEGFLKHTTTVSLAILLVGFGTCMPMVSVLVINNTTHGNMDCGILVPVTTSGYIYMGYYLIMSDLVPGLLVIKSSISIVIHLGIHLYHMKASTNGFHGPKLGSEMRVIRMTLGLVAVFFCFVAMDLYMHYRNVMFHNAMLYLTGLFTSVYTAASSLILLYSKKSNWKELLHIYNQFLDEYPCLACLKVPEGKRKDTAEDKH
ncbi:taste receptor, type 2, member 202 [Amia ocellicauda]|uniref:taste receptor, type 2, member 202 n=1 Tax=Amia ocellicauda TaxID=2972642 RepID=UPI0034640A2B